MLSLSTWASAFSVQQRLSPYPAVADPVAIAFDPRLGTLPAEPVVSPANAVHLPLRVSGLAPESILVNDRTDIRVIGRDGTTLFRGRTTLNIGYSDDFPVATTDGREVRTHQRIDVVYEDLRIDNYEDSRR